MRFLDRIEKIEIEAKRLRDDAEFAEFLTTNRGEITMSHVSLHAARMAIARAKEAIDRVSAEVDAYGYKEAAE